jgi:hypothetical protein
MVPVHQANSRENELQFNSTPDIIEKEMSRKARNLSNTKILQLKSVVDEIDVL